MTVNRIITEIGKAFFIGILVFIIVSLVAFANGVNVITSGNFWERFIFNQLYAVVLYVSNMFYFYYLINKYDKKLIQTNNLAKGIIGGVLLTVICISGLRYFTSVIYFNIGTAQFLANEKWEYYYVSFLISSVVTSIFYGVYYYKYRQESKVKEQKMIAGTASAQFDALKNQLDPHFLFNSLNVLTSLIEENPTAATKFTTALSKVYRYVLEQKNKELVTVKEELNFAKLYMSLLAMRFEDSLDFKISENISDPEAKVVPLALQLLLENAVKHNQVTPSKKLYITIQQEDDSLIIANNLQPKQVLKDSSGVGLNNIKQRYKLLTNKPVTIQTTRSHFSIAIPMLPKNFTTMKTQDVYVNEKRLQIAKERVEKIKGFYIHLSVYCVFVPIFIYLWFQGGAGFPWFFFPIGGWGLGVLGHASEAFDKNPFFSKDWEKRQIKKILEKGE